MSRTAPGTPSQPAGRRAVPPLTGVYERMLTGAGLAPVAGADEAGRGACAGPLVAAAVILSDEPERQIPGLDDSKALTGRARDRLYPLIFQRAAAVAWVVVEARDCDRLGIQRANLSALRQAVLGLGVTPGYVLTDGFPVDGLPAPNLGMWKGDQVAACVSAASIVAKVTRDRIMEDLEVVFPGYGFGTHKGYATAAHQRRLDALGPCPQHRLSYGNVARAAKVE